MHTCFFYVCGFRGQYTPYMSSIPNFLSVFCLFFGAADKSQSKKTKLNKKMRHSPTDLDVDWYCKVRSLEALKHLGRPYN